MKNWGLKLQIMLKKSLSIGFVILVFIFIMIFSFPRDKKYFVEEIKSPIEIKLSNNRIFKITDLETFDDKFSMHNKVLAFQNGITEEEAFILGNLAKYWASNLIKGRKVIIKDDNDLIFYKYGYRGKFLYSGFCFVDSKPFYKEAFEKRLTEIRRARYKVIDMKTEKIYNVTDKEVRNLENYIIIRKSHLSKQKYVQRIFKNKNIKIFLTDSTTKWQPDRNCTTSLCQEILFNINNADKSIDLALYGYSRIFAIEEALKNAIKRGVKIRLVIDMDDKGKNIYPDTERLLTIVSDYKDDRFSNESQKLMHNKFCIFDDKILITGSANLSHTDMSGFNSNSVIVIDSLDIAKIYKQEFEQMYSGKFHNEKTSNGYKKLKIDDKLLEIYFSPQHKSLTYAVLPLIRNAKKYIYIPTFVLTERRVTEELIKAKKRGVDVRIIIDALNASIKHSKHNELRAGGLLVKTENYAGKMHSKSMIVDDEYTIIGSMNFSNSGENKNDENLIVIKDSEIAKFYKDFFLYQWDKIDNKWLKSNVRAEGKQSLGSCFDGVDNNYDGFTDMQDIACK